MESLGGLTRAHGPAAIRPLPVWRRGDHGLIGVVIGVPEPRRDGPSLRVDTRLMSCRVIGRTVDQFTFRAILDRASGAGYRRIISEYIPTAKNAMVRDSTTRSASGPTPKAPAADACTISTFRHG